MTKGTILVFEDESQIRELVTESLEDDGFEVIGLSNGRGFESILNFRSPDLIILDQGLPDRSGQEILRAIRSRSEWATLAVIMVTGNADVESRISGLEEGADDYIAKPFDTRELLARVHSVLRRCKRASEMAAKRDQTAAIQECLSLGDLRIDNRAHRVFVASHEVTLTLTEFRILRELLLSLGGVVPRRALLERVLGRNDGGERSIDVHVAALRRKIGPEVAGRIETVRGIGYRLNGELAMASGT